jgi:O-antigen/teichoic acid export membrane protein
MFAAQAANAFSYQGDRLLVSTLGSPAVAGLYALCVNVANKTTAAVAAMSGFAFPHAAELMAANRGERIGGLLQSLDRAIAVLIVPVVLPALLLAEPFLVLWIRDFATQEVVFAFRILVIAFALPAFAVPLSNVLAGVGRSDLLARFAWLTVVVLFVSSALLVPRLGLVGAALAMLCANSTTFLFSRIGRRALQLGPAAGRARFWAGILLGCLVQLAPLIWLSSNAASWAMLLGGGLFTWALFYLSRMALKILSPEERELISRAGRRLGARSD